MWHSYTLALWLDGKLAIRIAFHLASQRAGDLGGKPSVLQACWHECMTASQPSCKLAGQPSFKQAGIDIHREYSAAKQRGGVCNFNFKKRELFGQLTDFQGLSHDDMLLGQSGMKHRKNPLAE